MNIFRVLAQGDGTINEPNVSAFLGYLLNPTEDHGLDSLFLEEFLKQHYQFCKKFRKTSNRQGQKLKDKNNPDPYSWLNDDFRTTGKYEVKVFFEQAFKDIINEKTSKKIDNKETLNKREIVDIILIIYEVGNEDEKVEKKFENYITDQRRLKQIFLIEIKIRDSACKIGRDNKEGQLENQILKSYKLIKLILEKSHIKEPEIKEKLSAVFVTPGQNDCVNAKTAFINSFNHPEINFIPKSHIFWNFPKDKAVSLNNFYQNSEHNQKLNSNYILFEDKDIDDEELKVEDLPVTPKSIENILDDIIYPSKYEKQQPIPFNTLDTVKAFSNYLYSDFSYKIKKPSKYQQKPFETFEDLKNAKPTLLIPELYELLDKSVKLIKSALNNKIDKDNFGTNHIFSLKVNDNKFADFTKRGGRTKLLFRFLYKNFPLKNEEENIDMISKIISSEKVDEIIQTDANSIFFTINSSVTPQQISKIVVAIYQLYQDQLTKK